MITIIIVVAYMGALSIYVYKMMGEKESRIKEGMRIMGLREGQYFLSYFIQYIVIFLFAIIINSFLFKDMINHIPIHFGLWMFLL